MSMIPSFCGRGSNSSSVFDPFSLDVWDHVHNDFPFFFPRAAATSSAFPNSELASAFARVSKVDWRETPEAHVFKADLPGLGKEEVKVEVEDGKVLHISGERTREKEDKGDTWHRVERSSGKFMRRFRLPENAKVEEVKAGMDNGVLTVTVPKENYGEKPSVRVVDISG